MATITTNRRSLFISAVSIVFFALAWALIGAVAQPRALAAYRTDYEVAKFGKENPVFVRIVNNEDAVRAGETFARDYEKLEDAGYFMAPIRVLTTAISHDKYDDYINPSEREKFEKERRERENREAEADAERLREIRERERENNN
ncbi:MAG: hypothetical protein IT462_16435 [Planctomycetes bacterium]|nr:hypothetical protein [Planctomycetota bacterium]